MNRALLLFLAVLLSYLANGRTIGAGDSLPAAYLPWSILVHRTFSFDAFPALYDDAAARMFPLLDGVPYYLLYRDGHYLSAYTPGPGLLALPIYLLPIILGVGPDPTWAAGLEKLSASIITALSALFLYWALLGVTRQGWAFVITLVYALGTSSLSVSAQGLWQHGPSQLFLSVTLMLLVKGLRDDRYLGYAGSPMAAAVAMRATDLLLVLPVAAWIAYAHRRRMRSLVLSALPLAVLFALYYGAHFGRSEAGLGYTTAPLWALFAGMPLGEGLPGVLISPSRGLFVYSPVLLVSLIGIGIVWQRGPALWRSLSLGIPMVVLVAGKWLTWWGGHSWGPRLLADLAPIMCFFLYPVVPLLDRRWVLKVAFAVLALWSIGAHALGAWVYDRRWDALATEPIIARLWPWHESPLAFYGREAISQVAQVAKRVAGVEEARPAPAHSPAGSLHLGPTPSVVTAGERFAVAVSVGNMGHDRWPAARPGDRGAVRLGWRWYLQNEEAAAGRALLLADVAPGGWAQLTANVIAPAQPGHYALVFDLVSEFVTWFGGQTPVTVSIQVLSKDAAPMVSRPVVSFAAAPAVRVSTARASYRVGDIQPLDVTITDAHRPRAFDAYLMLEQPDGRVLFFDGHTMPHAGGAVWPRWISGLPLPARVDGRFAIPLSGLSPGAYRWHAVLTAPGSFRPVARGTVGFEIEDGSRARPAPKP